MSFYNGDKRPWSLIAKAATPPAYRIVGTVSGYPVDARHASHDSAAYDLCQALNTGHDGMSTIHANDSRNAMYRLMSLISQSELVKEHAAYDLIAAAFDIIVCVNRFLEDGSRKIVTIHEIGNRVIMDEDQNKTLPLIPLWEYQVNAEETIANKKVMGSWVKVNELSDEVKRKHNLDIKKPLSWDELKEVAKITNKDGAK